MTRVGGGGDILELGRVLAVLALVVGAAALATPRGRLPLALRGLAKILGRARTAEGGAAASVPARRRLLAFALALAAILLALIKV